MSWARKWNKSPIISLAATVAAIGAGIFGVTEYFSNQEISQLNNQHENRIEELNAQLASIHLQVDDDDALELDKLILKTGDRNAVPTGSTYFQDDSFYAEAASEDWKYELKTEVDIYRDAKIPLPVDDQLRSALGQVSVHVWRAGTPMAVIHENQGMNLQPSIMVQRLDDDQMAMTLGIDQRPKFAQTRERKESLSSIFKSASSTREVVQVSGEERFNDQQDQMKQILFNELRSDRTGKYFQMLSLMQLKASLTSPSTSYLLNQVQKCDDTLYAQTSMVFQHARVDGELVDKFYLHNEELYISDDQQIYFIRMQIPTTEPVVNQRTRAEMIRWLEKFRIVR